MAFEKVDNPKFSATKGFWKPTEGETLDGVVLKIFKTSKLIDGKPSTPFFVVELLSDGKKLTIMNKREKVAVKKGDLIAVNRSSQLEALDLYPGYPFRLTFKGIIPLDGVKKVKDFELLVDQEKKIKPLDKIPWAGSGMTGDTDPSEPNVEPEGEEEITA